MRFARVSFLFLFAIGFELWGQGTAQINGAVTDATGLVVPAAEVKVTQTATGLVRTATSGENGDWVFPNLPIGPYMIEISKAGFSKYVQSGIVLQVDANPTVEATLKVGSVTEQVMVRADTAMVETRSTGIGQVIDSQRVLELPLNGRQPTELIFLAGMATLSTNNGFLSTVRNYPTVAISVAGGLGNGITYNLDGANHNDTYNNLNLPLPFPDALQEFKVEYSALPAQYGLHAAATVNAVTKSGTNQFHGDLFEFFRNGKLNSRNSFATARDTLKRNQFGGVIGGPILTNKLFFFGGYQGTIQRSDPPATNAFVPTQAMLEGDFTAIAGPGCNNGSTITLSPALGFVGNKISPALLNPAALKIQKLLPASADPCGRVIFGRLANQSENLFVGKVDLQKSARNSMFIRATIADLHIASTYDGKNALTLFNNAQADRIYSLALGNTFLFNSSMVGLFRAGLNRAEVPKVLDVFPTWKELGVDALTYQGPPRLAVSGNGFGIGGGGSIYNVSNSGLNPNVSYDISWVKGSHQIGFGAFYMHQTLNYRSGINATGLPTFNGQLTGLSLADFMMGKASTWVQGNPNILDNRQHQVAGYIQDTWKMNSRLTVSYGLRWEPFLSIHSKYSQLAHFDAERFAQGLKSSVYINAPAGQIYPGDPAWPSGNQISSNRYNQFFPRIGLVFDPSGNGRMTIRMAYGMFTDRAALYSLSAFAQDAPYGNVISLTNVDLSRPWANYSGGQSPAFPIPLSKDIQFPTSGAYITYPLNLKPTYLHQWNFGMQRQVGADLLLTVNYVGNSTLHIMTGNELNPALFIPGNCTAGQYGLTAAGLCSSVANINARRLLNLQNPAQGRFYSVLAEGNDGGTGTYNGLFFSAQKRLSKGVSVLANYTWSHCIADLWNGNPGNNGTSAVTPGNRRNDRGNCQGIDQRQVFNLSAVFQAPTFSSSLWRILASNWRVSPILRMRSSQFTTVTAGTDRALSGEGGQRANLVPGVDQFIHENNSSCSPAPCYKWLNPDAFAIPTLGTLGNLGQYNIRGPKVVQMDLAVTRNFKIREGQNFEVRGEAFNAPNRVNLDNPNAAKNSGNFGQILGASDPRIMQLALKYIF
jgi:hypothetical protein